MELSVIPVFQVEITPAAVRGFAAGSYQMSLVSNFPHASGHTSSVWLTGNWSILDLHRLPLFFPTQHESLLENTTRLLLSDPYDRRRGCMVHPRIPALSALQGQKRGSSLVLATTSRRPERGSHRERDRVHPVGYRGTSRNGSIDLVEHVSGDDQEADAHHDLRHFHFAMVRSSPCQHVRHPLRQESQQYQPVQLHPHFQRHQRLRRHPQHVLLGPCGPKTVVVGGHVYSVHHYVPLGWSGLTQFETSTCGRSRFHCAVLLRVSGWLGSGDLGNCA